jgi:PKD repeat protein
MKINKNSHKLTAIIALCISTSCSKKPEACFTLSHDNPYKVGESVGLDGSCSKNARYYSWYYGDKNFTQPSDQSTSEHTYTVAGVYSVKLRVEGANSNDQDINQEVTVVP